jgi:hypothetical protein
MTASTKPFPLGAVVLILAINAVFFFAFARVGGFVGAEAGTDGYKEIAENILQGNGSSLPWSALHDVLVLVIVGISGRPQWSLVTQFLLTFAVVFLLAYVMVRPLARYSSPVMPVLMLFGSVGLVVRSHGWGGRFELRRFDPRRTQCKERRGRP